MQRRTFNKLVPSVFGAAMITSPIMGSISKGFLGKYDDGKIIGHGDFRYKVDAQWGVQDAGKIPVKDCHEMVQDKKGRLILLTNEIRNNVLIYDRSGKVLSTWGNEFPGAHGLTLSQEGEDEFLFITDHDRNQVFKTTLDGRVLMTIDYPKETGKYDVKEKFRPTEVAVAPNGDFYVADGYGEQFIMHYDSKGRLLNIFGGRGDYGPLFNNVHGVCLDDRDKANPTLLVTARVQNALKRFTLGGEYIETIKLPGAFISRPVIDGDNIYTAVLVSKMPWNSESGFVLILDKDNKVVSIPGGNQPTYDNGGLKRMLQKGNTFKHPHDVCVDNDKNLYIPQWSSGKTYPIKLERI
jgi:hypothetical protein